MLTNSQYMTSTDKEDWKSLFNDLVIYPFSCLAPTNGEYLQSPSTDQEGWNASFKDLNLYPFACLAPSFLRTSSVLVASSQFFCFYMSRFLFSYYSVSCVIRFRFFFLCFVVSWIQINSVHSIGNLLKNSSVFGELVCQSSSFFLSLVLSLEDFHLDNLIFN